MQKEFHNKKGQMVGYLMEGIYRKKVNSTKHLLKVMNAYGIEEVIVDELKELGTKEIRILETDKKTILSIPFDQFVALGVKRNLETPQIFLPIHYFSRSDYKN